MDLLIINEQKCIRVTSVLMTTFKIVFGTTATTFGINHMQNCIIKNNYN